MGSSLIGFIITLVLAYILSSMIRQCTRDKLMPLCFACIIWVETTGTYFVNSTLLYYGMMLLSFISAAIILSDYRPLYLKRNVAMWSFILFLVWYGIPGLWHSYAAENLRMVLVVFRAVMVGYVAGCWALRTYGGMERLMIFAVCAITISALQFMKNGSWDVAALSEGGGRAVLSDSFKASNGASGRSINVNGISLMATSLLPYVVCYLFNSWSAARTTLFKCLGGFSLLVLAVVVIRTGSRNGGLALAASAIYVVLGKTSLKGWRRSILLIFFSLMMVFMIVRFVGQNEMRAFQLVTDDERHASRESFGSGRFGFFMDVYKTMSPGERIFGGGPPYEILIDLTGRRQLHIANRHSVYMQVLNTSGWVGVVLMVFAYIRFVLYARGVGSRGHVAMLFWGVWALTGVGEAANIIGGGKAIYALGFALALCSRNRSVVLGDPFLLQRGGLRHTFPLRR